MPIKRIYHIIDYYPDLATYFGILIISILELLIGNNLKVLIFSIFMMFFTFLIVLPTNIALKNLFKTKRPDGYRNNKISHFKGSFPSFHTQFSFGVSTAFITAIYLLSPDNIKLLATLLAIFCLEGMSVIVGYSRIVVNAHYPKDVVGGAVFGIITGFICSYTLTPILKDLIV
ncbi:phosphatase PAP2 family protein [Methanotorris formicicus]|uniref:Phosphoesterase PA-phosphatase related protein n=1 Tax=Methanotorris formicicus Mc-S-70 TaxID=647171 RepID=H1L023_9EURY|nr:phosphatase PAP2 family protein [Methanotorris formicicus]EHP85243.1 phosphoesterase PA-phosphatase related protein [Methanotorris formicicus Mc-S-70]